MISRILTIAIFVVVGLSIGLFLYTKRSRSGTEFCPQTFETRTFNYYENYFGRYNMDRDIPAPACGPKILALLNQTYIASPYKRWDLVTGQKSDAQRKDNAAILTQYLDMSTAKTSWNLEDWSAKQPAIAALLWPMIQELAVHEMYFAIPDLIGLALGEPKFAEYDEGQQKIVGEAILNRLRYLNSIELSLEKLVQLKRTVTWSQTWIANAKAIDPQVVALIKDQLSISDVKTKSIEDKKLASEESKAEAEAAIKAEEEAEAARMAEEEAPVVEAP
jgi:hypothetical protein